MLQKFIDIERLIHSLKTAIACIVGYILARTIGIAAGGQWIVVTVIVVMCAQLYVGSVYYKAYVRFFGTLIGCMFATITLVWFGVNNLTAALTIGLSSFVFSYFATGAENLSYAGTLGAVTTAIILMTPNPTLHTAVERFLEIGLGILIATLTSQFVLPIHARTHLRRTQAETFEQLRDHYISCMNPKMDDELPYEDLDEIIVKSLSKQRQLAKEAVREPLGIIFDPKIFVECLYSEKEILRAIDFMHHAILNTKHYQTLLQTQSFQNFNDEIIEIFNVLAEKMRKDKLPGKHIHLPSVEGLRTALEKQIPQPNIDDLININGFLFSAETLTRSLARLARIYQVPIFEGQ